LGGDLGIETRSLCSFEIEEVLELEHGAILLLRGTRGALA
jgi:hypothetical protein